jgi:hypothetical protein
MAKLTPEQRRDEYERIAFVQKVSRQKDTPIPAEFHEEEPTSAGSEAGSETSNDYQEWVNSQ